jgi:hypothetical protein
MKKYLRTLHQRPDAHKKRFALLVAGVVTLLIFAVWSFVTFSQPTTVADSGATAQENLASATEANAGVTPFQDILSGIKSSIDSLKSINLNQDYQSVRNSALPNTNGQ